MRDRRGGGVALRPGAVEIAAHQNRAAAGSARRIELGAFLEGDGVAQNLDRAAGLARTLPGCVERARDRDRSVRAAIKHDLAARHRDRAGLRDAGHVDHIVDDVLRDVGGDQDLPAIGIDLAVVRDRRRERATVRAKSAREGLAGNGEIDQAIAAEIERRGRARCQLHLPQPRRDHAAVAHAGRDEGGQAGGADRHGPLIDDRCGRRAGDAEIEAAAGDEAGDVGG